MSMSKKDYVLIAKAIHDSGVVDLVSMGRITASIAAALAADNPRFNPDTFIDAAMGSGR